MTMKENDLLWVVQGSEKGKIKKKKEIKKIRKRGEKVKNIFFKL